MLVFSLSARDYLLPAPTLYSSPAVLTDPVVNKRMSRELEPYLYRVAVESRRTLPQGHFVAALTQRLTKALPFNERTIKVPTLVKGPFLHMPIIVDPLTTYYAISFEY